jgi:hypothetical protein
MFSRSCLLSFALLFGSACRVNGPVIGQTADGPVIGPTVGSRPTQEPVLASEVTLEVITKRAPDVLIAPDGSNCRVAPDVFANTRVGSMFRCRWLRN